MNINKGYKAKIYVSASLFNKAVLVHVYDYEDSGYTEEIHSVWNNFTNAMFFLNKYGTDIDYLLYKGKQYKSTGLGYLPTINIEQTIKITPTCKEKWGADKESYTYLVLNGSPVYRNITLTSISTFVNKNTVEKPYILHDYVVAKV